MSLTIPSPKQPIDRKLHELWQSFEALEPNPDELLFVMRMVPPLRDRAAVCLLALHPTPEFLQEHLREFPELSDAYELLRQQESRKDSFMQQMREHCEAVERRKALARTSAQRRSS